MNLFSHPIFLSFLIRGAVFVFGDLIPCASEAKALHDEGNAAGSLRAGFPEEIGHHRCEIIGPGNQLNFFPTKGRKIKQSNCWPAALDDQF